ncbi:hypothetical protein [Paenibacillus elgii]|uniref:hypothetical protein n=1 Tax=Paenibacillus elgii TaxID=189691 RepID=UPI00203E194B|nr:hypothetical protein [Paenibacillus elgii]MCM3272577.1 hypothetical protein [Paenibacillus elgii]
MTYTEQQIRNMQPGPEMDKQLANVLGINVHLALGEKLSTTWEGMGLVLEKVKTLHEYVFIEISYEKGKWACYIWFGVINKAEAFADEAPHAVAMAALALRGGEQG